jgi:hypothetical protein
LRRRFFKLFLRSVIDIGILGITLKISYFMPSIGQKLGYFK